MWVFSFGSIFHGGAQLEFTMRVDMLSTWWLTSRCCVRGLTLTLERKEGRRVVINHLIIMLVVEA